MGAEIKQDEENQKSQLRRTLEARHLQMIAIGGTIGTGLFIGGGATIAAAGPGGALVAFAFVSVMVFFIVTSLGEMAAFWPVSGSFNTYANRFVDPALAFTLGWNYWFQWAVSLPSELSAAGLIIGFWSKTLPAWVWSAGILGVLLVVNALGVKSFGETEYVFSLIKVVAVVVFIFVGILLDVGLVGGEPRYFEYFTVDGAPFKNGLLGIIEVFLIAFFSFGGTELVGVTAGETKNPAKNVPKAIYGTFWRILIFYILTIFVIGLNIRNDDPRLALAGEGDGLDVTIAPFTLLFERIPGLKIAAHIMNGVIFSAVLSAANSAMYAASRTLMSMAQEGRAPSFLGRVDARGVPWFALLITSLVGSIAFLGILVGEGVVFYWLIRIAGVSGILTWLSISVIHLRFREAFKVQQKDLSLLPYQAPLHPFGSIIAILFGILIITGQAYVALVSDKPLLNFVATFCGVPIFLGMFAWYKWSKGTKIANLATVNLDVGHF